MTQDQVKKQEGQPFYERPNILKYQKFIKLPGLGQDSLLLTKSAISNLGRFDPALIPWMGLSLAGRNPQSLIPNPKSGTPAGLPEDTVKADVYFQFQNNALFQGEYIFKLWDQSVRGILISKYGEPDSVIFVNGKDTGRLWKKWRDKEITLFEEQSTLSDSVDVFLFYQMPETMLKETTSDL